MSLIERFRTEPALVTGVVSAAIALGTAFGLNLSADQVGAIMAFVVAAMAIVVRQQVTPTIKVSAERDLDKNVDVAGEALSKDNAAVETGDLVEVVPTETPEVR